MTEPVFRTQNLILSGKIGLSFNMALPELDGVDYSTSYMTFRIGNSSEEERVDYSADGKKASGNQAFVVYVNSIQMADTITAVYHYTDANGTAQTVSKTYTVETYLDSLTAEYGDKLFALGRAINDYGYYAQQFLSQ